MTCYQVYEFEFPWQLLLYCTLIVDCKKCIVHVVL